MSESSSVYSITLADTRDVLLLKEEAKVDLNQKYSSMAVLEVVGRQVLLGYDKEKQSCDTYELSASGPWVTPVPNNLKLHSKTGWDIIEPFVIGDQPHLCCYRKEDGEFALYPVNDDLTVHYPLYFRHPRHPLTPNLTMVKPREALGQVFITGYDTVHGFVNNWTVSVTATSDGKHPPLAMEVVWAHQWAKGWTRFAWFTWGGQNFFLKTNTWKPNVNIDHMSSVLSQGSSEVGSHLDLKDAQTLDIVHPFYVGKGDPYFLTYIASSGATTLNRVHGDCMGWTTVADETTATGASHIVPWRTGEKNFLVYA